MGIDVQLCRILPDGKREPLTLDSQSSRLGYFVDLDYTDAILQPIAGESLLKILFNSTEALTNWQKLLSDVNLFKLQLTLYKSDTGTYHSFQKISNTPSVRSAHAAADFFRSYKQFFDETFTESLLFPDKTKEIAAILAGFDNDKPCAYVIYKSDLSQHIKNVHLIEEMCNYVLAQPDPESYILVQKRKE